MSTIPGAVPTALVSAMGKPGSDKPFTYLPGGMDFSELKNGKMAKRMAKQQNGTNVQHHTNFDPMSGTVTSSNFLQTLPDTAWRKDSPGGDSSPVGTVDNPIKPVNNNNYLSASRSPEAGLQALADKRKVSCR